MNMHIIHDTPSEEQIYLSGIIATYGGNSFSEIADLTDGVYIARNLQMTNH